MGPDAGAGPEADVEARGTAGDVLGWPWHRQDASRVTSEVRTEAGAEVRDEVLALVAAPLE